MAKAKTTAFFCKECGYESSKWLGQCPACRAWNTLVEEPVAGTVSVAGKGRMSSDRGAGRAVAKPALLSEIRLEQEDRISTGFKELDRVLGDGIVAGSLVLVGGDPGIGKSTLLLQVCRHLAAAGQKVLYISGEESLKQIKMRAQRLGGFKENVFLLCETDINAAAEAVREAKPDMVVVDSVQTMYSEDLSSAAGSVSQVREVTAVMMRVAKENNIAVFIVGHVTKEGVVAGPRVLEHMVDTVLYFEGDRNHGFRILRGVKNRFGSTNEIGVFTMTEKGLEEVDNPSQALLNGRPQNVSGSVVVSSLEGTRPILVELQALVCQTNFNMPRRTSVGIDYNRVNLILAVMEKRVGMNLWGYDAYVNIAGGMKVNDTAVDLGVAFAIASSMNNKVVPSDTMIIGEIGLAGEIRGVTNVLQRVKEADKMGFATCIIPKSNYDKAMDKLNVKILCVSTLVEALSLL